MKFRAAFSTHWLASPICVSCPAPHPTSKLTRRRWSATPNWFPRKPKPSDKRPEAILRVNRPCISSAHLGIILADAVARLIQESEIDRSWLACAAGPSSKVTLCQPLAHESAVAQGCPLRRHRRPHWSGQNQLGPRTGPSDGSAAGLGGGRQPLFGPLLPRPRALRLSDPIVFPAYPLYPAA